MRAPVTQARPNGAIETARRAGVWRRMRLRRADGKVYLDRWGLGTDRFGGVLLHRMSAPDPGVDLHDHPWWFASLVLWGGYVEERADTRDAPFFARLAETYTSSRRGEERERRPGTVATTRLDECHRIIRLRRRSCWTVVVRGPRRRRWGFYLPDGWVDERTYDETIRSERRDMWNEVGT